MFHELHGLHSFFAFLIVLYFFLILFFSWCLVIIFVIAWFINWLIVRHQVCDISSIVMIRTSLKITNRADKRWSRNGSMSECFRSIYFIVKTNGSDTICIQLNIVFSKMRIMLNIAHLYKFTYIIQLMAMCTRQDIMW
jgi:hypothetical protein